MELVSAMQKTLTIQFAYQSPQTKNTPVNVNDSVIVNVALSQCTQNPTIAVYWVVQGGAGLHYSIASDSGIAQINLIAVDIFQAYTIWAYNGAGLITVYQENSLHSPVPAVPSSVESQLFSESGELQVYTVTWSHTGNATTTQAFIKTNVNNTIDGHFPYWTRCGLLNAGFVPVETLNNTNKAEIHAYTTNHTFYTVLAEATVTDPASGNPFQLSNAAKVALLTPPPPGGEPKNDHLVWIIVGSVVGGLLVIGGIVGFILYRRRHRYEAIAH